MTVQIAGVASTPFGEHPDSSTRELFTDAGSRHSRTHHCQHTTLRNCTPGISSAISPQTLRRCLSNGPAEIEFIQQAAMELGQCGQVLQAVVFGVEREPRTGDCGGSTDLIQTGLGSSCRGYVWFHAIRPRRYPTVYATMAAVMPTINISAPFTCHRRVVTKLRLAPTRKNARPVNAIENGKDGVSSRMYGINGAQPATTNARNVTKAVRCGDFPSVSPSTGSASLS